MRDLDGRAVFITGGGQGIGLGMARAFARAGCTVALADIDEPALAAARAELSSITDVETVVLDVRDRDAYAVAADDVESRLGAVSVLCNNAGVAGRVRLGEMSYETWDWVRGINFDGVYNGIQTFLPRMLSRGEGHIVNTSSGAGLAVPGDGVGFLYHASKFGVVGLSESLRVELAPEGIGVSLLCPGPVATNILTNTFRLHPRAAERPSQPGARLEELKQAFAEGAQVDDVGEMVLRAVVEDRPYVHTDGIMREAIESRTAAILEAMPGETPPGNGP